MDNKLLKEFQKFAKKKRLDEFYQYIKTNNLTEELTNQLFYEMFKPDPKKDYTDLINCIIALGKDELEPVIGKETSNRLLSLIHNEPYPKMQVMHIKQLCRWGKEQEQDGHQGIFIEKILDVFSQQGMTCGMHKIGFDKRRNIKRRRDITFST